MKDKTPTSDKASKRKARGRPSVDSKVSSRRSGKRSTKKKVKKKPSKTALRKLEASYEDDIAPASLTLEIDFYQELKASANINDFAARVSKIVNRLGFSRYYFLRLDRVNNMLGESVIKSAELLAGVAGDVNYRTGTTRSKRKNTSSSTELTNLCNLVAAMPPVSGMLDKNLQPCLLVVSFGQSDYYIVPVVTDQISDSEHVGDSSALLSIFPEVVSSIDFQNKVEANKKTLALLAKTVSYVGSRRFADFFMKNNEDQRIKINPGPLRLVKILAHRDVSLTQAADILGISLDTVNKHMATAKIALRTNTIVGTVLRAIKEGLVNTSAED